MSFCANVLTHMDYSKAFPQGETLCALRCHLDRDCAQYLFMVENHSTANIESAEECIILVKRRELVPVRGAPFGMALKTIVNINNIIYFIPTVLSKDTIQTMAWAAGFNRSVTVDSDTIFLKEIVSNDSYDEAMLTCLSFGGILPMEDTDEFVDQMSILAEDSRTPRFISMAKEVSPENGFKSLVWMLGKHIWNEGEDIAKCSNCQNWIFKGNGRQVATINPINKMYEHILPDERRPKYFCQYMGPNLATHKRVLVSSTNSLVTPAERAVDGNPFQDQRFWHSGAKAPKGEWLSIDLGKEFWISSVLFLGRLDAFSSRNQMIQVWIGGPEPKEGVDLDTKGRRLCGLYPFRQYDAQLSGVTCPTLIWGRFVTMLNSPADKFLQFNEVAIYGLPIEM